MKIRSLARLETLTIRLGEDFLILSSKRFVKTKWPK